MTEQGFGDDVLMDILAGLVEDFAGRPTEQPSLSPPGPSTTGPTSVDDSAPVVAGQVVPTAEELQELLARRQEQQAAEPRWEPQVSST